MKIKEIEENSRPREKLIAFGASNLSDIELLAIIIGSGMKNISVLDLANNILKNFELSALSELSYEKLVEIKGIKKSKACSILASFELVKRSYAFKARNTAFLSATEVFNYMKPILFNKNKEFLYILYVDTKARLLETYLVSEGDISSVSMPVRKIISRGLEIHCYGIFMVHNHPSGDINPSVSDIEATNDLFRATKLMRIILFDHVIIAKNKYYSFHEKNILGSY